MNNMTDKPDGAGGSPHIWLRYATQFTTGGRTHTIEMGIPVPLGASTEMRAQLIREAEAGMNQLSSHVENRVTQMLQRNQRPQTTLREGANPISTPMPSAPPSEKEQKPLMPPASNTEKAQKLPIEDKDIIVPPTRTSVGASMPLAPGLAGDAGSNLTLTQFLHFIKGTLGLSHQQAKDLLQVKSLNGLNLRDALERLQYLATQNSAVPNQKPQDIGQPKPAQGPYSPGRPQSYTAPTTHVPPSPTAPTPIRAQAKPPVELNKRDVVYDERPTYRFDEEDDLEEDEGMVLHDMDESEDRPALTAEELLQARTIMSKLKEVGGVTTVSPARLTVLRNVVGSQISEEQLERLLQALWGTAVAKRLKVDQVEALISWAKEDDFVGEAEAVLTLIEEG